MSEKKDYITIETLHGKFNTVATTPTYDRRKKWEPFNPKILTIAIPGTILELYVKEGDKVEVGDKLFLFKAMKMDNTVYSDIAGTIKSIKVAVGAVVPKGEIVVEFE